MDVAMPNISWRIATKLYAYMHLLMTVTQGVMTIRFLIKYPEGSGPFFDDFLEKDPSSAKITLWIYVFMLSARVYADIQLIRSVALGNSPNEARDLSEPSIFSHSFISIVLLILYVCTDAETARAKGLRLNRALHLILFHVIALILIFKFREELETTSNQIEDKPGQQSSSSVMRTASGNSARWNPAEVEDTPSYSQRAPSRARPSRRHHDINNNTTEETES